MTDVAPGDPSEDPRDALIREQAQLIAAQAAQIAALEATVAGLREQLEAAARAGSRNSGNSSMPPSSDDLPGRKPPRKQRRAAERAEKKKRGKQPGSPGTSMTWEVPDRTEDHHPGGACSCGRDLAGAADLGVARSYQQEEIPAAAAERVQHDLHEARCACGRVHAAARPAGVPDSALSTGPRLRALAVYLVVFQHVPVERCRQLIADVTGAAVSDGFIHSCLAKAASLAADVVRLIRTLITAAAVAGFDETTLRSGPAGEKKYASCSNSAATAAATCSCSPRTPASGPRNNLSERGVRPLKTQQKISGRLASNDVTQDRLDIRSYIDTARKHGNNAMNVLHDLMLGRPWRPPAQAFSP